MPFNFLYPPKILNCHLSDLKVVYFQMYMQELILILME